jgi:hypothetical protein
MVPGGNALGQQFNTPDSVSTTVPVQCVWLLEH